MSRRMATLSLMTALIGTGNFATSSRAQNPCNGSISTPVQTAFTDSACPGTLNRKRTWAVNATNSCNETGTPPGAQTNSVSVTMDAKGTCDAATGEVQCWYSEGLPAHVYGDPDGLAVGWYDGVRVGSECQIASRLDAKFMPNIGPCLSSFCCSSMRQSSCTSGGYSWDASGCRCTSSPLIVLFDAPWESSLTSPERGAPFELMPGVGTIKVAWPRAGARRFSRTGPQWRRHHQRRQRAVWQRHAAVGRARGAN